MKKIFFQLILPFSFLLALLSLPNLVQAKIMTTENSVHVSEAETVADDLIVAGETVTVDGVIEGDLYAFGGVVTVTGVVTGDLIAAGGSININGAVVGDDLRIAGGNITVVNTQIADGVSIAGGNVSVLGDSTVGGGVMFAGGMITLDSPVERNVYGAGGSVHLNNTIGRDIHVAAGKLSLGPRASVGGALTYTSEEKIDLDPQATIAGEIKQIIPEDKSTVEIKADLLEATNAAKAGYRVWSFVASLVVGTLLVFFFPATAGHLADQVSQKVLSHFGVGLLALVFTLPFVAILFITVIGLPLGFLLLGGFFTAVYFSKIIASLALGKAVLRSFDVKHLDLYTSLIVGLVAYYLGSRIPFLGFFICFGFYTVGLGSIVAYLVHRVGVQRQKK